jgi:hypothetical protein
MDGGWFSRLFLRDVHLIEHTTIKKSDWLGMPSLPDRSGQYRDRECFAPRHQIGGDHHAPVNTAVDTASLDHPAFFPGALDPCHRHQPRALVIDHLGSCCRPVVIPVAQLARRLL